MRTRVSHLYNRFPMSEMTINDLIRITAECREQHLPGLPDEQSAIHYSIFYPVNSHTSFFSGMLAGNNKQRIEYKAPDNFIVNGSVCTKVNEHEIVLFGDLYYGFGKTPGTRHHFDGTILIFPFQPTPAPPPVPIPNECTEDFPAEITVDEPLFPYIAISSWNQESYTAGTGIDFYSYDPAGAEPGSLYKLLVADNTNRQAMENLAAIFVQSTSYYGNLQAVPEPFNVFPAFYDLLQQELTHSVFTTALSTYVGVGAPDNWDLVPDQLWQNYFALTILTNYNEGFYIDISKILVICNLLKHADLLLSGNDATLKTLLYASNILPSAIFPLPPYQRTGTADSTNSITPYAIGELKMTRYKLLRYQQGEVARIQNVLKGEKKKLVNRSFTGSREQLTDQTVNDNETTNDDMKATNELTVEVSKTIAELTKNVTFNNLTATYGPPAQVILNGSYTTTTSCNGPLTKDSSLFATRVLNRTLSRINESVLRARVYTSYREQEEITASVFNNQSGTTHLRGVYRWVNKLYRISVENYGNRFLFEFRINEPAKPFKAAQLQLNDLDLEKPIAPRDKGINNFTDITLSNYAELFSQYEVKQLLLPPEDETKQMLVWQMQVYNAIMESYQHTMASYNDRLTRFSGKNVQSNPLLLNNIIHSCLESSCHNMLKNVIFEKIGEEAVFLKRCDQFMQEAFEWNEMTYVFNDQPSRLSYALQGEDDSLRPFLQASYALVYLPVRPAFNFSILYFLSSGIIAAAPSPFVPVNANDVLVAQQLKRIQQWYMKSQVERSWVITLPTAMQVIQDSEALPIFHH